MSSEEVMDTPAHPASGKTAGITEKVLPWTGRRKKLERDLEHVNKEIYRRNLDLAQTNKTLALLRAIDSLVLDAGDSLQPLATKLAKEVVKVGYPFVGILGYASGLRGGIDVLGWASTDEAASRPGPNPVDKLSLKSNIGWLKTDEVLQFINLSNVTDAEVAHFCKCTESEAVAAREALNLKGLACIKLSARQRLVGIMVIGFADQRDGLNEFERALFVRLSEAVGIAIDHKILQEENQNILSSLQRANLKLRKLDQTKDDFISMASHQLRTPLTSVKGYVSMVLDGDAGEITETQRKLLMQSFLSSQRMVYLISDLLNVSRLKTGKFVIEPVPTDLAQVIQEEVDQLAETVKGRDLTLEYHRPEHFPVLMVDETKIRQVMMNFIDNAVYYTPAGGHIDVYLVEKPDAIEFTVVDNGIGVPKHEQHHLFTKFYRAHNAKRSRPDGTGLGIFMAKKVVIAQGGAILFKSEEGKGSTFGFTFPKAKLPLAPAK